MDKKRGRNQNVIESKDNENMPLKRQRVENHVSKNLKWNWTVTHQKPLLPHKNNMKEICMNGVSIKLTDNDLLSIFVYELDFEGNDNIRMISPMELRWITYKVLHMIQGGCHGCVGEFGEIFSPIDLINRRDEAESEVESEDEEEDTTSLFLQIKTSDIPSYHTQDGGGISQHLIKT